MPSLRRHAVPRQVGADVGSGRVRAVAGIDPEHDDLPCAPQQGQRVGDGAFRLPRAVPRDRDRRRVEVERTGRGPDENRTAGAHHDAVREPLGAPRVVGIGLADDGEVGIVGVRRDDFDGVAGEESPFRGRRRLCRPFPEPPLGLLGALTALRRQPFAELRRKTVAGVFGNGERRRHIRARHPALVQFRQSDRRIQARRRTTVFPKMNDNIPVSHGHTSCVERCGIRNPPCPKPGLRRRDRDGRGGIAGRKPNAAIARVRRRIGE